MSEQEKKTDKKVYQISIGGEDRTSDFALDMLEYVVNVLLSKPCTKRFRSKLDGVYSITEVLNGIFVQSDKSQTLWIDNGTYNMHLTIAQWTSYVEMILALFTEDNVKQTGFKKDKESPAVRELVAID